MPLKPGQFSYKHSQKTLHSSPVRASYGVHFVDPASDWYSASVHVIIYVTSYNIGPRYGGTRLYIQYKRIFTNDTYPGCFMLRAIRNALAYLAGGSKIIQNMLVNAGSYDRPVVLYNFFLKVEYFRFIVNITLTHIWNFSLLDDV